MKASVKLDTAITETIVRLAAFGLRFAAKRCRRSGQRSRELAIARLNLAPGPTPADISRLGREAGTLLVKAAQLQKAADDLLREAPAPADAGTLCMCVIPRLSKEAVGKMITSGAEVIWRSMMTTPGFRWANAEFLASEVWKAMVTAASNCVAEGAKNRAD
jgi:hypothetical protein